MGVIYKIKPEVRDYILQQKQTNPALSCRGIAPLVEKKFQVRLSKSSINSIFKQSGLSMPVGRRLTKKKEPKPERLLLAVKTAAEALIGYKPIIEEEKIPLVEPALVKPILVEPTLSEPTIAEPPIQVNLADIYCVKIVPNEGNPVYLDAKMYSVWSTLQIPTDFSVTDCDTNSYVNNYLSGDGPIMLFSAPGYNVIPEEFFNFILALKGRQDSVCKLVLYNDKFEELKTLPLKGRQSEFFVCGLWPWQHLAHRKVKNIGAFRRLVSQSLKSDFYIADIEIELSQATINQSVTLRGCALKTDLKGKIQLVIVTNMPKDALTSEGIASSYLGRWPNPIETFQDFNRKSELFTYVGNQHYSKDK